MIRYATKEWLIENGYELDEGFIQNLKKAGKWVIADPNQGKSHIKPEEPKPKPIPTSKTIPKYTPPKKTEAQVHALKNYENLYQQRIANRGKNHNIWNVAEKFFTGKSPAFGH